MKKLFGRGKDDEKAFQKKYQLRETLGKGAFAIVKEGVELASGRKIAVKIIQKKGLAPDQLEGLQKEVQLLARLNHPNILRMEEFVETSGNFYIVMELCSGGELFDRIVERSHYSEKDASELTSKITTAIQYLHRNGIIHRDLKPENLIYTTPEDNAEIKIADFGLAALASHDSLTTACGTPGYVAPEVLQMGGRYSAQVDMWSVGVILYILLCGFPPFYDENQSALFEQIKKGQYDFPSPHWDDISNEAKDLVTKLLTVNPEKRYTPEQVLAHAWIKNASAAQLDIKEKLKAYNARRKFKKNVNAVIATNKLRMLLSVPSGSS